MQNAAIKGALIGVAAVLISTVLGKYIPQVEI